MDALSQAIVREGKIELGVASRVLAGINLKVSLGGIEHFTVPAPRKRNGLLIPTRKMISCYRKIIDEFSPDVIHVHGVEFYCGIVTAENRMGRPCVISLQGIITQCQRHFTGGLGFLDILKSRTLRNWILFDGLWEQKARWKRRAAVERRIIRGHNAFIGRTLWDRALLRKLNPSASYFHCHEMVRREFFDREWNITTIRRNTVFAPSANYPLKGFHVLLRAISILRREFPNILVRVPLAQFNASKKYRGFLDSIKKRDYTKYLDVLIDKLGIAENVVPLGCLSGSEMAEEMKQAHVFALSSFVENSPNTMAEALTVGVPSVVSLSGGIPSLINEGENVLGYPPGDEAVLAEQIRRIFLDDSLAIRLSKVGRETALYRHSAGPILKRMFEIYKVIVEKGESKHLELP